MEYEPERVEELKKNLLEALKNASNIRNVNGKPQQTTDADPRFIDYYGRPWAKNWEKNFEVGWDKPNDDLPANVLDILDLLDGKKR